jgi:hypothetical protein
MSTASRPALHDDRGVFADHSRCSAEGCSCYENHEDPAATAAVIDLMHFANGKLTQKLTYAKTKTPLFQD